MKIFVLALCVCFAVAIPQNRHRSPGLVDNLTWRVESEGDDHITYVRQPVNPPQGHGQNGQNGVDCNQTTTEAPQRPRSSRRGSSNKELRSGLSRSQQGRGASNSNQNTAYGAEGDYWWQVSHRTDDAITYVRRNSTEGQNQAPQGQLRQLGTGQDAVLARVVRPGKDNDDLSEEAALLRQQQALSQRSGFTGYTTNELVHPYVKKTKVQQETRSLKTKSLSSGRKSGKRGQLRSGYESQTAAPTTTTANPSDDHPPRVGDEVNGWVVISKSKDHISWARAGTAGSSSSSSHRASSVTASRSAASLSRSNVGESRLRSLQTARRPASKLIPSAEGELIEGFPRIFNTYSRSSFTHETHTDESNVASIRTSLTNATNWNVGDELAGWKVISKDHRGIVWEKIKNDNDVNEEDLINQLNQDGDDSSSESSEEDGTYKGPPGTWYLAKESANSITWQRDNVPADVVFDMNAFPRIGDTQSGWKVSSKSREHISWVRINADGTEVDSLEVN